jgi:hypothetical protein
VRFSGRPDPNVDSFELNVNKGVDFCGLKLIISSVRQPIALVPASLSDKLKCAAELRYTVCL